MNRATNEVIIKTLFKVGMVFTLIAWVIDWIVYLF